MKKQLILLLSLGFVGCLQCSDNKTKPSEDDLFADQYRALCVSYESQLNSGKLTFSQLQQQACQEQQLGQVAVRENVFTTSEALKAAHKRAYNNHLLRDMAMNAALASWKASQAEKQSSEAAKK